MELIELLKDKKVATPCYIIDEQILSNNFNSFRNEFKAKWGENFIIGYSYKTNSLPWILNWMKNNGVYAEVVSEPEYRLALNLGYKSNEIIINGPYKGLDALKECLDNNAIVNLDSFHEIEWIKDNRPARNIKWQIGLRINFDLENECPLETIMGNEPGRFGFNIENGDFQKAVELLNSLEYVEIVGLHGHHSTKTKSLNIFKAISKKMVNLSKDLKDIKYIDMGGCIFGDKPGAPTYTEYANIITETLTEGFDPQKVTLIMEPGAALVASCFKYVCKVIDYKNIKNKNLLNTDGSLIHINPQMTGVNFNVTSFATGEERVDEQTIGSFTCIEKDRMAVIRNEKKFNIGDWMIFNNVGAYSMSLSPLFIQYYPYVYVLKENSLFIAREGWSIEQYMMNSFIDYEMKI